MTSNHRQPPQQQPILTVETSQSTNTTFVQADPSNFRVVVQTLTGSTSTTATNTAPPHPRRLSSSGPHHAPGTMSAFKLHERRQANAMRKLEMIKLNGPGPGLAMVSPVSTLDGLSRGVSSPSTPIVSEEEENAIIAKQGFYLHPSNNNNRENEPKLLPLFPLHSHGQDYYYHH